MIPEKIMVNNTSTKSRIFSVVAILWLSIIACSISENIKDTDIPVTKQADIASTEQAKAASEATIIAAVVSTLQARDAIIQPTKISATPTSTNTPVLPTVSQVFTSTPNFIDIPYPTPTPHATPYPTLTPTNTRAVTSINNSPPVADANIDQNVRTGSIVILDGSGSNDAETSKLAYDWMFILKPEGSNAILSSMTAVTPTFTAAVEGVYVIRLIVNDGELDSEPDTITINAGKTPFILIDSFPRNGWKIQKSKMDNFYLKFNYPVDRKTETYIQNFYRQQGVICQWNKCGWIEYAENDTKLIWHSNTGRHDRLSEGDTIEIRLGLISQEGGVKDIYGNTLPYTVIEIVTE